MNRPSVRILNPTSGHQRYTSARNAERMIELGLAVAVSLTCIRLCTGSPRLPVAEDSRTIILDGRTYQHHRRHCGAWA